LKFIVGAHTKRFLPQTFTGKKRFLQQNFPAQNISGYKTFPDTKLLLIKGIKKIVFFE